MLFREYTENFRKIHQIKVEENEEYGHEYNVYEEINPSRTGTSWIEVDLWENRNELGRSVHLDANDVQKRGFMGYLELNRQKLTFVDEKETLIQLVDQNRLGCKKSVVDRVRVDLSGLRNDSGVIKCYTREAVSRRVDESIETNEITNSELHKTYRQIYYERENKNSEIGSERFVHYSRMIFVPELLLNDSKFIKHRIGLFLLGHINSCILSSQIIQMIHHKINLSETRGDLKEVFTKVVNGIKKQTADSHSLVLYRILATVLDEDTSLPEMVNRILLRYSQTNHALFYGKLVYYTKLGIEVDREVYINFCNTIDAGKYTAPWYYEILSRMLEMYRIRKEPSFKMRIGAIGLTETTQPINAEIRIAEAIDSIVLIRVSTEKLCKYFQKDLKLIIKSSDFSIQSVIRIFYVLTLSILDEYPHYRHPFLEYFVILIKHIEDYFITKYFGAGLILDSRTLPILEKIYVTHLEINKLVKLENSRLDALLDEVAEKYTIQADVSGVFKDRINQSKNTPS
ncbi:hypothetical protein ECANGB1_1551 [Enterospora canceri]|uniref:Uncharacterized protein n=1 Tax=Enterospora canceri TaxID=1081671 RepID=A0A1Y1S5T9_9MICR|nr:hypothetical protein ECANGB1_1551 [Enterospora canceri]